MVIAPHYFALTHRVRVRQTRFALGTGGAALQHERSQPRAQRVGVEAALDLAVGHHRHAAGFLRNHDRDRIIFFRQTDRRPMARPELLAEPRVDRQRQKTGRGRHAIVLHDDRAVVERRRGLKNAQQQIVRQQGVERNAALDVVAQADLALERDDGADALRRQHARGDHQLFDRFLGRLRLGEIPEERRAAQMRERAADVGLKEHDDGEDEIADQIADQPVDGLEMRPTAIRKRAPRARRRRAPSARRGCRESASAARRSAPTPRGCRRDPTSRWEDGGERR